MNKKINFFGFNHISPDLTIDERDKLIKIYKNYHQLAYCYQLKFQKLSKLKLALHLSSISPDCCRYNCRYCYIKPYCSRMCGWGWCNYSSLFS